MTDTPAERATESTWSRLRRRKVVQWGLVYVAAAWGFLQGIEYVSDAFQWPPQFRQVALLALLIGLPVVLVLAWYHGDRGEQRFRGTAVAIIALIASFPAYAGEHPDRAKLDTNGDGSIDLAEIQARRPDFTIEKFNKADADRNGLLSQDELADGVEMRQQAMSTSITVPRKDDIKAVAEKVGNYWMTNNPCNAGAGNCPMENSWNKGVLMMGIVDHWRKHPTATAYKTYALNWANAHSWQLYNTTPCTDWKANWHNRMTAGYTYLRLKGGGVPGTTLLTDTIANLDAQLLLPVFSPTDDGTAQVDYAFGCGPGGTFSWKALDAEFTALPTWIAYGKQTGNTAYYARAYALQNHQATTMRLQDPTTKLWYRDETFAPPTDKLTPAGLPIVWGRGTGWIAGGLANALAWLPTSRTMEHNTYKTRFIDLMNALSTRQRADGFWGTSINDPNHHNYNWTETSGTALITYAMAKGIKLGILNSTTYRPIVARAWNALVATSVRNDGYLGYCQGLGYAPTGPSLGDADYCVGAFLLAGTAMHDLGAAGTSPFTIYQAEDVALVTVSGGTVADVSNSYSQSGAHRATLSAVNSYVEYTLPNVPVGTPHSVRIRYRLQPANNAIWQMRIAGAIVGTTTDGYDNFGHYAEAGVPWTNGTAGDKTVRFTVTGKNAKSTGTTFNIEIDSIKFMTN